MQRLLSSSTMIDEISKKIFLHTGSPSPQLKKSSKNSPVQKRVATIEKIVKNHPKWQCR